VHLLRKNFGAGHIIVWRRIRPTLYRKRDLDADLRANPWTRSLSGHPLKPFADLGENGQRLVWYTMLRDPIKRFISHYQHQFDRGGREDYRVDFRQWMETFPRDNWMVRMMAGEDDLEAAKQIMQEKIRCVGFMEKYNESLLVFRHRMNLPGFDVTYVKPKNVAARTEVARKVADKFDEFRAEVIEQNKLDLELYNWALRTLWAAQVEEYGAGRLSCDLEKEFGAQTESIGSRINLASNYLHRNLYYKPFVRLDKKLFCQYGVSAEENSS